jgi:hypothetical protein
MQYAGKQNRHELLESGTTSITPDITTSSKYDELGDTGVYGTAQFVSTQCH